MYVTHDQTEAMTLGHRVAVLDGGRVLQVDSPQRLYEQPANVFVAAFIGTPAMNLVEGSLGGDEVSFGGFRVPLDRTRRPQYGQSRVVVGIRPEAFDEASFAAAGATTFTVVPVVVEELGSDAHVFFHVDAEAAAADVTGRRGGSARCPSRERSSAPESTRAPAPASASRSSSRVDPARLHFFDPDSGATLLPDDAARGRAPRSDGPAAP